MGGSTEQAMTAASSVNDKTPGNRGFCQFLSFVA
jgi:hypothetical protein